MAEAAGADRTPSVDDSAEVQYMKGDFWGKENLKHVPAHYRLQKAARIVNRLAGNRPCTLLDVGCGPATLERLLRPNIEYFGIDIAIHDAAPNLLQADIVERPIGFGDRRFDLVLAQGLFEYLGTVQSQKFAEIAELLNPGGMFVVTYTNFGHRKRSVYWAYNNVQPIEVFRRDLGHYFRIVRSFPASHNWNHGQPNRSLVKAANAHVNVNIPLVSSMLAVEYFFVCAVLRDQRDTQSGRI